MVTVERAPVQDASLFAQLEQAPDTKQFVLPYSETEHARNILNSSFVYLRILDAGELVGFFILVLDSEPNSVEFRRAVVSDKGKGVGQSAITAMEQFCRTQLQRTRVWLDVFEYNNRGRHISSSLPH